MKVVESLGLPREGYPNGIGIYSLLEPHRHPRKRACYTLFSTKSCSYVLGRLHHDGKLPTNFQFIVYARISPRGEATFASGPLSQTGRSWINVRTPSLYREAY